MRVTIMGSGTSSGVPLPGCLCATCTSTDLRNRRMRPGLLVELDGGSIVVDTSPDFREQVLRHGVRNLEAVLYTHAHADHIFGFDDLRAFNFLTGRPIPCFGLEDTLERIRRTFAYAFEGPDEGGGKPQVSLHPITEPFEILGAAIVPIPVWHGSMPVLGYRLGPFALVTDVKSIPESSWELLRGVQVLVLSALRYRPHPTHFNFEEAIEAARRIGAARTWFTHIAHDVDHAKLAVDLPPGMEVAYDGLVLEL